MRAVLEAAHARGDEQAARALNEFFELRAALWIAGEQGLFEADFDDDDARARTAHAEAVIEKMLMSGSERLEEEE